MTQPLPTLARVSQAKTLEELREAVVAYSSDLTDVLASVPVFEFKTLYFQTQDLPTRLETNVPLALGAAVLSFRENADEGAAFNIGALNIRRADDEDGGLLLGAVDTSLSGLSANTTYVAELMIIGKRGE